MRMVHTDKVTNERPSPSATARHARERQLAEMRTRHNISVLRRRLVAYADIVRHDPHWASYVEQVDEMERHHPQEAARDGTGGTVDTGIH